MAIKLPKYITFDEAVKITNKLSRESLFKLRDKVSQLIENSYKEL